MTKFPVHYITREPSVATGIRAVKEMWPFVAGFAFTSYLMIKVASSVTDEDIKQSKFTNPRH